MRISLMIAVLTTFVAAACSDDAIQTSGDAATRGADASQNSGGNGPDSAADAPEAEVAPPPECTSPLACNDGNPCTTDLCEEQKCMHAPLPDEDTVTGVKSPCDDSNKCTNGDSCVGGKCKSGTIVTQCNDFNPCTNNTCNPLTGGCIFPPNTATCTDNNACTTNDQCVENTGMCDGEDVLCEDKNPCTEDSCDKKNGCKHALKANLPCNDNNQCTTGDLCNASSTCVGKPVNCSDGNSCTQDTCENSAGCVLEPSKNGDACDDGNPCTEKDACQSATCTSGIFKTCTDDNPCTKDSCDKVSGTCQNVPSPLVYCDDGDKCTATDLCVQKGGTKECVGKALLCDDGNPCTADNCDAKVGCGAAPQTNIACEDGNGCTVNDTCQNGKCASGLLKKDCNDDNPCTSEFCDTGSGTCKVTIVEGGACTDASACTVSDKCSSLGKCVGIGIICDDDNQCTDDTCNKQSGCQPSPQSNIKCDDGNECTKKDLCVNGKCNGSNYNTCEDLNVCTLDTCDYQTGACYHINAANSTGCNDNDPCTIGDKCNNGKCAAQLQTCDDNFACTMDTCDAKTGKCKNEPIPGCKEK